MNFSYLFIVCVMRFFAQVNGRVKSVFPPINLILSHKFTSGTLSLHTSYISSSYSRIETHESFFYYKFPDNFDKKALTALVRLSHSSPLIEPLVSNRRM
jgi:hypothetical protein